jgi:inhibitor of KinA sporulation pathway (predicted exonuclease)
MNYTKIVFFDLEMCCWEKAKKTGEIIEIGLAVLDIEKNEIVKKGQYYVKPEKDEVSGFCTELTGITPLLIKKQGRPLKEAVKTMVKNFGGKKAIYAAWGRDDIVLFNECKNKGIEEPFNEFLNIATTYRIHKKETGDRVSLQKALNQEGVVFEGKAHSGMVDAYNLAKLYQKVFL